MNNRNISAKICLFPSGFGGREGPFLNNMARLGVIIDPLKNSTQFSAWVTVPSRAVIPLAEIVEANVNFINNVDTKDIIRSGSLFWIFEGARRIGVGLWE